MNINGPLKGYNVTADQGNYDLVYNDIIINSTLGIPNSDKTVYRYQLRTDNINRVYKAELVSATIKFNTSINNNVKNNTLLLSIPQLNSNTFVLAGQGANSIFSQVPDNCTPLGTLVNNNTISLLIGGSMYTCTQFYNPPISKINQIDISWSDIQGNFIPTDTSGASGTIGSFYFTLRIYYFQKRNNVSTFSTSVFTTTGNENSIFNP